MSKVTVTANDEGQVIVPSKNPEFGYIRVEQKSSRMVNGWVRPENKSALIKGAVEDLKALGYHQGQTLEGKIVIVESLEPVNADDPKQGIKMSGDNGIACTFEGQPIYREAYYTEDMEATDTLIAHDNVEEVRAHSAKLREKANLENA
jgi:hypothetical protein